MERDRLLDEPLLPEGLQSALHRPAGEARQLCELGLVEAVVRFKQEEEELRRRGPFTDFAVRIVPKVSPRSPSRSLASGATDRSATFPRLTSDPISRINWTCCISWGASKIRCSPGCSARIERTQSHLIAPSLS